MNISLTQELERLVQSHVDSGLYNNASEVVREALRLFLKENSLNIAYDNWIKTEITEGIKEANGKDFIDSSAEDVILRSLKRKK